MKIGVLGGGQLGRMLALAGYPLGFTFRFFDPAPRPPAAPLAEHVSAQWDNRNALARFADGLDLVTYEFENVPVEAVAFLAERVSVLPPPGALEVARDRLAEKEFLARLGVPTAPFAPVSTERELAEAATGIGFPAVLKTRRLGYDGKGQFVLQGAAGLAQAWEALGGRELILEGLVNFRRELSLLALRGRDGCAAFYPLTETVHQKGVLRLCRAPASGASPALREEAKRVAGRVLEALDYAGVLALELFETGDGVLVNEIAPRVHNSGHWTIEGSLTSQFENHLRALAGLPLGDTSARGYAATVNLLGRHPDHAAVLRIPGAHLHLYGKEPEPGRKLGHVTVTAGDLATLEARLAALAPVLQLHPPSV